MFSLENKTCLVTGAGSGIGAAIAETFARAKGFVFVTDRDEKGGHQTVARIHAAGGKSGSKAAGSPAKKQYQRDEPEDPEAAFEMHLYRGPAYDQVTPHEAKPGPSATPPKLGEKARDTLNDVVHDGMHEWMNELRKMLGADPI